MYIHHFLCTILTSQFSIHSKCKIKKKVFSWARPKDSLTLNPLVPITVDYPSNARNANAYLWRPSFGNVDSPLYLNAQCLNTERIMKTVLCHICV